MNKRKEFGIVNLVVEMSPNEVKIWACDPKEGRNVFRLKATGKVYAADISDIIVQDTRILPRGGVLPGD